MEPMDTEYGQKESNGCINPFCQDAYHMGTYLGKNVCVMYPNHSTEECPYLIIVNTRTGERLKINF